MPPKDHKTSLERVEFTRNLLAFILIGAFITAIPLFVFKMIPAENKEIITYMAGQLSGMATLALGFYFVNKVGQDALDAQKSENSGKAFEAITATAKASSNVDGVVQGADAVVDAAAQKRDEIKADEQ